MTARPQKTAQRNTITTFLAGNRSHPTAQEIYAAVSETLTTISLTTVYNTLNLLKKQGVVRELPALQGKGKRFDPDLRPHDHLFCTACGSVVDVDLPHAVELTDEQRQGFEIRQVSINIYGLCPRCKSGGRGFVPGQSSSRQ